MIKDRILKLFVGYEQDVQQIVSGVLTVEQEYISMKNPRGVKKEIREVIDRVIKKGNTKAEDQGGAHEA